jgi:hypothetical protein
MRVLLAGVISLGLVGSAFGADTDNFGSTSVVTSWIAEQSLVGEAVNGGSAAGWSSALDPSADQRAGAASARLRGSSPTYNGESRATVVLPSASRDYAR